MELEVIMLRKTTQTKTNTFCLTCTQKIQLSLWEEEALVENATVKWEGMGNS